MANSNTQKKRAQKKRKEAEWLANDMVQTATQMRTLLNSCDRPLKDYAVEDLKRARQIIETTLEDDQVRKEFELEGITKVKDEDVRPIEE